MRYESPRAGYSSSKRPLSVPSGRLVNPRLEHELPTNDVRGLGQRKIPTSSQHPTRGTNVPVVYARVASTRSLQQKQMNTGDVLFVCKSKTMFGAGVDRVSRCATLSDMNEMLGAERNRLSDNDAKMTQRYVHAREEMLKAANEIKTYNDEDTRLVKLPQTRQVESNDRQCSTTLDSDEVDKTRCVLEKAKAALIAQLATRVYPEFDWMAVPALKEWTPDGVLFGVEADDTVLRSVIPNASSDDMLLHVCIHGSCPVRNQTLVNVPQFFGEDTSTGDILYLCIVAARRSDATWEFRIRPMSSRQLRLHMFTYTRGVKSHIRDNDLNNVVAAWHLGRVVDSNLVKGQHGRLLVHVNLELMTRSTFFRRLVGYDGDLELIAELETTGCPPNAAAPPSPASDPPAPAESGSEREDDPAPSDATSDATPDATPDATLAPTPPDATPDATSALVSKRIVAEFKWDQIEYNTGRILRDAAQRTVWTTSEDVTWLWMKTNNTLFSEYTNEKVVIACQAYTLAKLQSQSSVYQMHYASWAVSMTEIGFIRALNYYLAQAGPNILDYSDICYLFSLMDDNGLTHALCVALKEVKDPQTKQPRFPMEFKDNTVRNNNDAQKRRAQGLKLLSFKLPDAVDGLLTLAGSINLKPFVEKAKGNTTEEKTRRVSYSLNLLFDLPTNYEWLESDVVGFEWIRSTVDRADWDISSAARGDGINDIYLNANAMGTDLLTSIFFILLCCFALLNTLAISDGMITAIRNEQPVPAITEFKLQSGVSDMESNVVDVFRAVDIRNQNTHDKPDLSSMAIVARESEHLIFTGDDRHVKEQVSGGVLAATMLASTELLENARLAVGKVGGLLAVWTVLSLK